MMATHANAITEYNPMHQLKTEAQDELIRCVNRNTAISAMKAEKQRRVHKNMMDDVIIALVSALRRQKAAKAERAEQQSRVAAHTWQYAVGEQIRVLGARRFLAEAEEAERQNRLENYPSPAKLFSQTRVALLESITRDGNAAIADIAAERERAERLQKELLRCVGEEIVRNVARANAMKSADLEQQERIASNSLHDICEEIRCTAAIANVKAAADIEQSRRIQELNHINHADCMAVGNYFGQSSVASHKIKALEMIERLGSIRTAIKAAEEEQRKRITRVNMLQVCTEIERRHAQKKADLAVNCEQQFQIVDNLRHSICLEIRSEYSRQWSQLAAQEEQVWRVHSGIDRTYWVVDPVVINEEKQETTAIINRMGSILKAKRAANEEKGRRMTENMVHEVCSEIRRAVNQRRVLQTTNLEQAQRITQQKMHQVCESIRRSGSVRTVTEAAESERNLRIKFPVVHPEYSDKTALNEAIERRGNQSEAIQAMECERLERIQRDRMHDVCGQLNRRMSIQKAVEACDETHAKAVCEIRMKCVFDSLVQQIKRKDIAAACEEEQLDLIETSSTNLLEFQSDTIKSLMAEIIARAC